MVKKETHRLESFKVLAVQCFLVFMTRVKYDYGRSYPVSPKLGAVWRFEPSYTVLFWILYLNFADIFSIILVGCF